MDPIAWEGLTIPPRRWLVPDLIPYHVPTMLSGMGGLGKTLLGLQLVHAATTKQRWIGREVQQVKTFGVFCEDDQPELQRRFHDINVATGTRFEDLEDVRLMIRDGQQSSLMDFPSPYEAGTESAFLETLAKECKDFGAQLIVLDSLYNFFYGNENNRVQVTQFIYTLRRLAKHCDAALVFIAHPSKAGISTGDGYAGSTAWHDAVRSRLYLNEKDDNGEKRLVLETMKANYGPREGEIEVYYEAGLLVAREGQTKSDPVYRKAACDTVFMDCLREVRKAGRNPVDANNSKNYAPAMFARMGKPGGFKITDYALAMERLFADKRIEIRTEKDRHRNLVKGIFEAKLELNLGDDLNVA